jgi:hypothetical protein
MNTLLGPRHLADRKAAKHPCDMDRATGHRLVCRSGRPSNVAAGGSGRALAPATVILLCLILASCSSLPSYVADHWPTWAGGMPKDVPPRPGDPGYEEFIAHRQSKDGQAPPANTAPTATPVASAPARTAVAPAATGGTNAQAIPSPRPNAGADVQGGLY